MLKINLLPWREELTKITNKRFGIFCALIFASAIILVGLHKIFMMLESRSMQNGLNILQKELRLLESQIKEVSDLVDKKDKFKLYVTSVDELQQYKVMYPVILDDLAISLTPNALIKKLKADESQKSLNIQGFVKDNEEVSAFIANLEKLRWVSKVVLIDFKNINSGDQLKMIDFSLDIVYKTAPASFYENS